MILLIRDNECFEPRVKNYVRYFEEHNIPYHIIAWNRNGTAQPNEHITFYEKRAEYGKRLGNITKKLGWMWFVIRKVISHRKEYKVIHACDIDGILPAIFMGKLLKKKTIYDIFDWISSLTGKGVVYKFVEFLQNFCYKHSDAVILCEEERKAQAKAQNENIFIIPNIPNSNVEFDKNTLEVTSKDLNDYKYVVSYVGVFDRDRGLENLLEVVSQNNNIKLNIAGFGVLDEMVREYSQKYPNITYWGRVEYSIGQAIQKNSNLISAMYHLTSPLHKFAAPNKYYESLMLGVPMITTENTLVGSKVSKYDTGFVISEEIESLKSLFECDGFNELVTKKSENCKNVWENVYKNYYEQYMNKFYIEFASVGDTNVKE